MIDCVCLTVSKRSNKIFVMLKVGFRGPNSLLLAAVAIFNMSLVTSPEIQKETTINNNLIKTVSQMEIWPVINKKGRLPINHT